jgi:tetratricopeptide (TPR) repeat protein
MVALKSLFASKGEKLTVSESPVLTLEPDSVAARRICNFLARHGGAVDPIDALSMARGAVALSPLSESFNALAGVLNEIPAAEHFQMEAADKAIADDPDNWAAWHNLSLAALRSYNWERAKEAIETALAKLPAKEGNPYIAMQAAFVAGMMGDHLQALLYLAEAENVAGNCADKKLARQVRAECGIARFVAYAHMKQWADAFAALESRHKLSTARNILSLAPDSLWSPERGTDCNRKPVAVVYLEWGLGDQIQFARYATDLAESGLFAEVLVACSAPLMSIMATLDGVAGVIDRDAIMTSVFETAEVVPVLDLMADHFKKTGDPVGSAAAYLSVPARERLPEPNFAQLGDEETAEYHRRAAAINAPKLERQPGKLAVCFGWQGDPRQTHDWNRRVPLEAFGDWARANADRFTFHSLQSKFAGYGEPWAGWPDDVVVQDCSGSTDFADVAALMQECDIFVGQCGGLIHLAGALGKDAIVLLGASHDWRWEAWPPLYHSVMGLVQSKPGDWRSVFDQLTDAVFANTIPKDEPRPEVEPVAVATAAGTMTEPPTAETKGDSQL